MIFGSISQIWDLSFCRFWIQIGPVCRVIQIDLKPDWLDIEKQFWFGILEHPDRESTFRKVLSVMNVRSLSHSNTNVKRCFNFSGVNSWNQWHPCEGTSCEGRCGRPYRSNDTFLCACDEFCPMFRDCCKDYQDFCKDEIAEVPAFIYNRGHFMCLQKPNNELVEYISLLSSWFIFLGGTQNGVAVLDL